MRFLILKFVSSSFGAKIIFLIIKLKVENLTSIFGRRSEKWCCVFLARDLFLEGKRKEFDT